MRGKSNPKHMWPIGSPEEHFDHLSFLNTIAILKVYAHHKFIKKETVYESCKSVALKIVNYALLKKKPRSGLANLISKVRSLRDRWMELRNHLTRKSETEVKKRAVYVDFELFKEFDLGKTKDAATSASKKPTNNQYFSPKVLYSKRARTSKLVS